MQPQELERRLERAERDTWVIAETERGFKIHSPTSGGRSYLVSGIGGPPCLPSPAPEPPFENTAPLIR